MTNLVLRTYRMHTKTKGITVMFKLVKNLLRRRREKNKAIRKTLREHLERVQATRERNNITVHRNGHHYIYTAHFYHPDFHECYLPVKYKSADGNQWNRAIDGAFVGFRTATIDIDHYCVHAGTPLNCLKELRSFWNSWAVKNDVPIAPLDVPGMCP